MKTLDQLISTAMRSTEDAFRENGRVHPFVYIHDSQSNDFTAFDFKDQYREHEDMKKSIAIKLIRDLRSRGRFGGAVMVSEAWFVTRHAPDGKVPAGVTPSECEDREEVLLCAAYDSAGAKAIQAKKICRTVPQVVLAPLNWPMDFTTWMEPAFAS